MKRFLPTFLVLLCTVAFSFAQDPCSGRYYDKLFQADEHRDINYGRAVEFDGDTVDLDMHIFEPAGDNFARRPLIILAFGGSFTAGIKDSPDIIKLCNEFAERGYVTSTIDYRLGFEDGNDSDTNQFKALFRGIQDMKAAIRFFYKDAQTSNDWRIDTNQIMVGGVSAGAFIGLNHGFFKDSIFTNPPPAWVEDALNEIGGLEGNSGNPGYSTKVKGVINLCGALADTLWIQPGDPFLVSVHGTADDLVFFYQDTSGQSVEGSLYGSGYIHERCQHIGHNAYLYSFEGAGHVPFVLPIPWFPPATDYMDTTITVVRDFLWENIICDPTLINAVDDIYTENTQVLVYPNPTSGIINLSIDNPTIMAFNVELFDQLGRSVAAYSHNQSTIQISLDELSMGVYSLVISDPDSGSLISRKKIVKR